MSVSRKRFRIEEAFMGEVAMSMPAVEGGDIGPLHREIMAELRSIRAQMASGAGRPGESVEAHITRVYRKLGIHSRAELGAWMAGRPRSSLPRT
jgi:hypothetical protein